MLEVVDGRKLSIMDPETFEVAEIFVGDMNVQHIRVLNAMDRVEIMVANEVPVKIMYPKIIDLEIKHVKNNTAYFQGELSLPVTGNVNAGDMLRINAETLEVLEVVSQRLDE